VISLGGSLIVPGEIDTKYLANFRKIIASYPARFIIVCGGGKTAREYMCVAGALGVKSSKEKDRIGIHATRLNACLLRSLFGRLAHPNVVIDPFQRLRWKEKVLVAAGYKPGWSSDYDAAVLAYRNGGTRVINLTNIEGVYACDPKKYSDQKVLRELTWSKYKRLIPKKWSPGLSTPFDPVASRYASSRKLVVTVMDGRRLDLFGKVLAGTAMVGTVIHP